MTETAPNSAVDAAAKLLAAGRAPVESLKGVGGKLGQSLRAAGIETIADLWFHLPLRYEDRTRLTAVRDLRVGEQAQVEGEVTAVERGFRFRPQLKVAMQDAAGENLALRFFHFHASQAQQFRVGRRIRVFGEPRPGLFGYEIVHPSYRFLADDESVTLTETLDPVYPAVKGVGSANMARLIQQALQRLPPDAPDLLPVAALKDFNLAGKWPLDRCLHTLHHPPVDVSLAALSAGQHPAQRRLIFEELLAHHLSLRRQRSELQAIGAIPLKARGRLSKRLRALLPFAMTAAQQRVVSEIGEDLVQPRPMLRLLQGDVGSGKTVVAALAALQAIEAGTQVAMVAPTELLAEQHLRSLSNWLQQLDVEVAWLAGKITGKARSRVLSGIADGSVQLVVGTHALMQASVVFKRLGLCVIDEQHRFGVHQRLALREKGPSPALMPHQLVMTATPIPRTLAMTAYADLDVSRIDELPPGRKPVRTVVISNERRSEVIERIRENCRHGTQAYWVCTLIEESEEVQAQAAESAHALLQAALPELRVGLIHGRLKAQPRSEIMAAFKAGELDLLVATTVIEVGVDVANASLMLIENAERLGLAQLHQLRGRVGRGSKESSCVLMYQAPLSSTAKARLETMRETNDGFQIAERDLELRGPGEVLGTRQTGEMQFRLADLRRDADLLEQVAAVGDRLLLDHPDRVELLVRRWIGSADRFANV